MGRRMRPLDPMTGPVERFASELRVLRTLAGDLPFWKMARRCEVSKSALAAAVAGRVLPSEKVTREFVRICGGDWLWWRERRLLAAAELTAAELAAAELAADHTPSAGEGGVLAIPGEKGLRPFFVGKDVATQGSPTPGRILRHAVWLSGLPRRRRRNIMVLCALVALAGIAVGFLSLDQQRPSSAHNARGTSAAQAAGPVQAVNDDTDPKDTGCDRGTVDTIATANLFGPDRFFLGYVWLRYAPACHAVWARFEPATDDMAELPGATVTVTAVRPSDGRITHYPTPYLGAFVYGNMLLTTHDCVSAEATVTAPHPTRGPATALPSGSIVAHAETACTPPPAT